MTACCIGARHLRSTPFPNPKDQSHEEAIPEETSTDARQEAWQEVLIS
jgi:hypothetical protein